MYSRNTVHMQPSPAGAGLQGRSQRQATVQAVLLTARLSTAAREPPVLTGKGRPARSRASYAPKLRTVPAQASLSGQMYHEVPPFVS